VGLFIAERVDRIDACSAMSGKPNGEEGDSAEY
jgi:hypothetical protein